MTASAGDGSPVRPNRRSALIWFLPLMLLAFGVSWRQTRRRREERERLRRQKLADQQRRRREKEADE